jgi:hypothetical protein
MISRGALRTFRGDNADCCAASYQKWVKVYTAYTSRRLNFASLVYCPTLLYLSSFFLLLVATPFFSLPDRRALRG